MKDHESFSKSALKFSQCWRNWNPDQPSWTWQLSPSDHRSAYKSGGYLMLKLLQPHSGKTERLHESLLAVDPLLDKETFTTLQDTVDIWVTTFYILYSESYGVPVLWMEVHDRSGTPVAPLDKALNRLHIDRASVILSFEEHPLVHRPAIMLHPCMTEGFMSNLMEHAGMDSDLYLPSWLSAVCQVVPPLPSIPLQFFKA